MRWISEHPATRRALLTAGVAGALLLGVEMSAWAGIVVLKRGDVLVGRVMADDEEVVVRWPYLQVTDAGVMRIPRHEVRWFDPARDTPSEDYWTRFLHEPLKGAPWERMRAERLAGLDREPTEEEGWFDLLYVPEGLRLAPPIDPIPVDGAGFSLRKPRGWTASRQDGITILEAPTPGASGFTPRIHVFSVRAAQASHPEQVAWIRDELATLAGGEAGFEVREMNALRRTLDCVAEQVILTETRLPTRRVLALRKVCFGPDRTVVFAAYADEREFAEERAVFEASLASLRLSSDRP